jgi:hypothetical protein
MKAIITTILALAFATASYAGCGKKAASIGKIETYDAETKALVLKITDSSDAKELKAKSAKLTLTPDTKILAEGDIASLVGKRVSVVSEHGKVDFVIALTPKKGKKKDKAAS